jgi:hypothetical protein
VNPRHSRGSRNNRELCIVKGFDIGRSHNHVDEDVNLWNLLIFRYQKTNLRKGFFYLKMHLGYAQRYILLGPRKCKMQILLFKITSRTGSITNTESCTKWDLLRERYTEKFSISRGCSFQDRVLQSVLHFNHLPPNLQTLHFKYSFNKYPY